MAKKRKRAQAEHGACEERTRRIDERLGGIFGTRTFDERTHMSEARIAELEARAAAKARGQG
jgi:hypothetical protein